MFKKATRESAKLRMAILGPAGSGKTYTALRFAFCLAGEGKKVAVIDTEHGSAAKYLGEAPDGIPWEWDVLELKPGQYSPQNYQRAIEAAGKAGYEVLVIDSLSHAWTGTGGALDLVNRSEIAGPFGGWKDVTPIHEKMIESILASPCHIIATLRTKIAYEVEHDENGKVRPKKVGLKPIQREDFEYIFDIVADLDLQHIMRVTKTRCPTIDQAIVHIPSGDWILPVKEWLENGTTENVAFQPSQRGAQKSTPTTHEPKAAHTPTPTQPDLLSNSSKLERKKPQVPQISTQEIKMQARLAGLSSSELKEKIKKFGAKKIAELNADQRAELMQELEEERGKIDPF